MYLIYINQNSYKIVIILKLGQKQEQDMKESCKKLQRKLNCNIRLCYFQVDKKHLDLEKELNKDSYVSSNKYPMFSYEKQEFLRRLHYKYESA